MPVWRKKVGSQEPFPEVWPPCRLTFVLEWPTYLGRGHTIFVKMESEKVAGSPSWLDGARKIFVTASQEQSSWR